MIKCAWNSLWFNMIMVWWRERREGNQWRSCGGPQEAKQASNFFFSLKLNQIFCFARPDSSQLWMNVGHFCLTVSSFYQQFSPFTHSSTLLAHPLTSDSPITGKGDATIIFIVRTKSCLYFIYNLGSPIPGIWQKSCLNFCSDGCLHFLLLKKKSQLTPGFRGCFIL